MKYFLTIIFAALVAVSAFSQSESGLYLTVPCAKKSTKHTTAVNSKQVCLAAHPIIFISDFEGVTDVQASPDKVWFEITMSNKAVQKLVTISNNLPESTFAFFVETEVFSTFEAKDLLVGRTFRFQGTEKHRAVFMSTQRKLKSLIGAPAH
jgi:hypothetical protein